MGSPEADIARRPRRRPRASRAAKTARPSDALHGILVQVDEATPPGRCEIAVQLAARNGGRVTGLYLRTDLTKDLVGAADTGQPPPLDLGQRIRDRLEQEDRNAATAGDMLKRIAAAAKVDSACRTVSGDTARDMITQARHADLVVVGPWDPARKGHAFAVDIVHGAGVPVLVVPDTIAGPTIGERVLVAWNGSRESSNALRDVLPILAPGALLEIRTARYKHDRTDTEDLRRYLERRPCRLNLKAIDDDGRSIPQWLIEQANEADCDLIVMGVYGHTRDRAFVLSDISQAMLQASTLPLLISD